MDTLMTMIVSLPYSLLASPFLLVFAVTVAVIGKKHGVRGAVITAASFFAIYILILTSMQAIWLEWWKHLLAYSLVVAIPLSITFVPMLLARQSAWLQGRLIAGLLGAAVATFTFFYVAHSISCGLLGDCL